LPPAYAFLGLNGLENDATAIRNAKPGSNELLIKRAMVVSVVTENGLLESFLADRWPDGAPPQVQPELEQLKKIYERYKQFKPLTCEHIRNALRDIDPGLVDADLALRSAVKATQGLPPSEGRFVAEVCVVADWGSFRLQGFPFKDRIAMARELEGCWSVLQPMQSHYANDWDTETKMLLKAVDDLASSTALLPERGDRNSQLSFLSKYLHFCINRGFPIWDSNARLVLGGNAELTWASYKEWLSLVRQEVAKHRECLERARREQDHLQGESLVRTLDKALYIIGIRIVGSADAGELHVAVTLE
jgi:hypothetical protein